MPGYHKTKSGKMAKKGLYYNITNVRKLVQVELKRNLLLQKNLTSLCCLDLRNSFF